MTHTAAKPPAQKTRWERMSYDAFLRRYMDGERLEWVDGKVVPMSPVTLEHEDERGFLLSLITEYAKMKRLGRVSSEPYNMKLGYGLPGRAPDILFVANANLARMHNEYLDGPADLVIEIISPESRRRDRVTKFAEYEKAGVREYWILDPARKERDFYLRDGNGRYQPVPVGEDGIYRSTVLEGLWIRVEWLWQRPLPTLIAVLKEWGML
jgi:Uma2 family endonuclease